MCGLERNSVAFEAEIFKNSLLISLLAGNLARERLAPDCLLRQFFDFCYLQHVTTN